MEANNMKTMREALANIAEYADCAATRQHDAHTQHYIEQIRLWARSALAKPPRNCDVGTAEEQFERWEVFCAKYDNDCTGCPCDDNTCTFANCFAKWAQMPYEEGGAK